MLTDKYLDLPNRLGLYPIIDSLVWLVRMLDLGITTIQLRIKDKSEAEVEPDIEAAIVLGRRYNARVFINDYWRLAIRHSAYGVHLGQEDINKADIHAINHAGLFWGISTHNEEELMRAITYGPSYIALGHIFPTTTKIMHSRPQGLKNLRKLVTKSRNLPTVAIGGISATKIDSVLECGVGSIAVVSAITRAPDWHKATINILNKIKHWQSIYA
ncbi:thiamine phosphate synthase [Candidatus Palibaumannia cicadellinicola]|uniref:Thiamine-phosphate synthase n=1 Tax=Baumannia cicadellinicola subsp. Homalodisca coagulata TaxID=374463 RepID=Q1LU44_BAUCH|nr:thiamine phosphate synthase [Candidatus Baumannia cicadellinicola]ABF14139.1 thiamine-phosphate pyrophosphorylase [Baumannia cicadellinicola str. Hc (Homalodisca coagulata)]MCJ7462506.1 thiamine phosphate synthase [Candidatus Baumannia cicadellinicola]MCJ7462938.1 thiamine phosphate synthase [Candidatus Baumannia cicadellinicola]